MRKLLGVIAIALSAGACAYNTPVAVSPNLNVYVASGEKLPGRYYLWVDGSAFKQTVKATGLACAAHTYPLDVSESFRQSVLGTVSNLVEDVQLVDAPVPVAQVVANGAKGMISVRGEGLTARFVAVAGFWTSTIDANVDMSASIMFDNAGGRLLATTAEGDGNAQSDSGGACEGAATAIGMATEKAMKELLGMLAERMANSEKVRQSVTGASK